MPNFRHDPVARTATQDLAPAGDIDPHFHDEHQIVYASRGVLAVTTDSERWISPAHRAIWVPVGTVHQHRAYGPTRLHTVGLPVTNDGFVGPTRPTVLGVSPLLRELLIAYTRTGLRQDECKHMHIVLMDQVRRAPSYRGGLPLPRDSRLLAIRGLLEAEPADLRSLGDLGRQVGASARTLSRLFRQETGMTFPQWRTALRLQHALRLLAEGMTVSRTAVACGWSTPSAFIDVFHRAYGTTPGSLRTTH